MWQCHEWEKGLYWQEVELAIQNIVDYYAGDIRTEEVMRRESND